MEDSSFKIFFGAIFVLLFITGMVMFLQMEAETEDRIAVDNYLKSRGKAPIPASWRSKIGEGI